MDILGYGLGLKCLLNGSSLGLKWKCIASPINSYKVFRNGTTQKIVYLPFLLYIYCSYSKKKISREECLQPGLHGCLGSAPLLSGG